MQQDQCGMYRCMEVKCIFSSVLVHNKLTWAKDGGGMGEVDPGFCILHCHLRVLISPNPFQQTYLLSMTALDQYQFPEPMTLAVDREDYNK